MVVGKNSQNNHGHVDQRTEADQPHQQTGAVQSPAISLPKGGGTIRGMGEKFSTNPVTGTGSMSVPIATSPGRSGFGPQLNLSYDSGAGNGPFGFGWNLGLPSVTRKTDKGLPRYRDGDESDVFLISGAEDLIPVLDNVGQRIVLPPRTVHGVAYRIYLYRPRIEGLFARIERWTRTDNGISYWRTITRDNVTTIFGFDENSRIADPRDPRRVFSYLICLTFDDKGNTTRYEYAAEDNIGVRQNVAHEANRTDTDRQAQRYLKTIRYGNSQPYFPDWLPGGVETPLPTNWHFSIVFDYGDHRTNAPTPTPDQAWPVRPDPFSTYRAGFEVRTYRRCERALLFHNFPEEADVRADCLVRSTDFHYSDETAALDPRNPIYTFLESVTQTGYRRTVGGYEQRSTPPLEFFYSQPEIHPEILTLSDADSRENIPEGLDGARFQWVDLDGEGLSGILTEQNGGWGYKRNLSPLNQVTLPGGERVSRARFGLLEQVPALPVPANLGGGQQLLDLSGGGRLALAAFDGPHPGFFKHTADSGWEPFHTFASLPRLNWTEPNLKFVDLTGDGRADVLITEDDVYTFYPSLGEDGFGVGERVFIPWDEDRGPRVVFADGTQTVSLADMSGDGLTDVVRVRNGEVCYWPNLGYGRFGAKVTMDAAPRFTDEERFDPRRVRLADIDGSGTADLIYIGDNGVQVCFNRSGNSWAAPQRLAVFPSADSLSAVQVTDLLGNGTACLVWSSPLPAEGYAPLRYVDLMGGQKPHLMIRSRNNLGAETRVQYAPSTRFYLEDKLAGRPWITRLPFPVQVVAQVETYDWIGRSRFVSQYTYHHGYFDAEEREFRGFGRVEQRDTETQRADTLFPDAEPANEAAASFVPPILTRTWFHTGAFVEANAVSKQYEHEYWVEPALRGDAPPIVTARKALLLPDTVIEDMLSPHEMRGAYRALKGSTLRIEVYAEDGTPHAEHPYTVTEQNFTVKRLQGRGSNQHAVFLTHARESLSYHYERQPDDPRVTHNITLEVDEFANVRRSISVGYPRRAGYPEPEPHLSAAFRSMLAHDQKRLHIGATEHIFTAPVNRPTDAAPFDAYRAPLPCETITAELTGIAPAASFFQFDELEDHWAALWTGAPDIPYEDVSTPDVEGVGTPTALARRIVERSRTFYRSDDMTELLPLGVAQSHALLGETYHLALTPGLIERIFGTRVTDALLLEGGYVRWPGENDWWAPAGRVYYSAGDADTPAQELAAARAHFYQVRRTVDPFGAISRADYDAYDLLLTTATDAVGNVTTASNNYRVLQPFRSIDPNGNQSEVVFDCLGMVVGAAVSGKVGEGDALAGFEPDPWDWAQLTVLTAQALWEGVLANPAPILNNATSRVAYDLFAYFRTRHLPTPDAPLVYTLTRETHVADLTPGQTTRFRHLFVYSDGFGREAQHKAQAERGPVPGSGDDVAPRWVGSGWTIYNNKGKPVYKYEPFFSPTHRFEFNRQAGVSSVLFYDPVERIVATLHPDNTFEKTVFTAWTQATWDANDTVLISDPRTDADAGDFFRRLLGSAPGAFTSWYNQRIGGTLGNTPEERVANQDAAQKATAHAGTPTVVHFDSLGRTCLSVANNGVEGGIAQRFATRTAMDTESKPLAVFDALGRHVMEFCLREPLPGGLGFRFVAGYDVAGNPLYRNGMDGGERRTLVNVVGDPLRTWDGRGNVFRVRYDALRRPTHRFVTRPGLGEILTERFVYGEKHPDVGRNLKGRLFRHYDSAGVASNERYDFKGNLLASARQLARFVPPTAVAAFYVTTPDWSVITNIVDAPMLDVAALDAATAPLLVAADRFQASSRFDALNRSIQMVTPHATGGRPSVIQPFYNEANLLERIDVWLRQAAAPSALLNPATADLHAVSNIEYNERGQRLAITLGNGAVTTYTYDPETFHLATLTTRRPHADARARTVQALLYTYDPVGNITHLRDEADIQNVIYFRNQRVEPSADYTYDALYRLTSATGREHLGQSEGALDAPLQVTHDDSPRTHAAPNTRLLNPGDGQAMGNYTERYRYDPVGNLQAMIHDIVSGSWTRHYTYAEPSQITAGETCNRLSTTSLPVDNPLGPYSAHYGYDVHGNMTQMPHLPGMTWDEHDRLQSTRRQHVNAGMPETTYYQYDADGQRVRKITYRQASAGQTPVRKHERLYLGTFEFYREYDGSGNLVKERETLHVLDDRQRVALVETRTLDTVGDDPGPAQLIRYQHTNHLGSALVELNSHADIISYEEYFPYGSTAYQAVRSQTETPKRYRYTGKERDEENDLYYHGARYYAPWLGRWTACDPAGTADSPSLYVYVRNNPIILSDPNGMLSWGQWAGIGAAIVVGAAVTVLTAGAAGPLVGAAAASVIGGIVGGAAGGAVGAAVESRIDTGRVNWSAVGRGAAIGAAIGGGVALATVGVTAAAGAVAASATARAIATRVGASAVGRAASAVASGTRSTIAAVSRTAVGRGVAAVGRGSAAVGRAAVRVGRRLHEAGEEVGSRIAGAIERRGLGHLLPEAAPGVPAARGPEIARAFRRHFGEPPEGVHVVGSRAEARAMGAWPEGSSPTTSDVDILIETARTDLTKHTGPGFEFFRDINPGRVPPGVTGIGGGPGEAFIGTSPGTIPKGGLLDPFFESIVRPPGDLRPFVPLWPTRIAPPHSGATGGAVGSGLSDPGRDRQPAPTIPLVTGTF